MKSALIIIFLFASILTGHSQSVDGALKTLTAAGTNTYTITEPTPSTYNEKERFLVRFTNANTGAATLNRAGLGAKDIKKADGSNLVAGDLQAGGTYLLSYNGTYYQIVGDGGGGSESTFASDVTLVLSSGKTFGKYTNGQTAPWTGLTARQAILDAAVEYINPVFNSFSVAGYSPPTVEVGTTISGLKTFNWNISANSGVVPTINLYDVTAGTTLLAGTANDGTEDRTVTTIQLNSNGLTQVWRGIGNNTSPSGTFNSIPDFTVTARFYRFFGPDALPTNSAEVRALPSSAFHTGATTFTLNTGTTETTFVVALPPGVTIASVADLDAFGEIITSEYVLQPATLDVKDNGGSGTDRPYNIYLMTIGTPYSGNHRHQITTAN